MKHYIKISSNRFLDVEMGCETWKKNPQKIRWKGNLANSKALHVSRKYRRMEARNDLLGHLDGNEFLMIPKKMVETFYFHYFRGLNQLQKKSLLVRGTTKHVHSSPTGDFPTCS